MSVVSRFFASTYSSLEATLWRFPISLVCAMGLFSLALLEIYNMPFAKHAYYSHYVAICIAGFFWFGGSKLFAESRNWPFEKYAFYSLLIFVFILCWILSLSHITASCILLISGIICFLTVAPFLKPGTLDPEFYNFNRQVWIGFAYSILLGLIFFLGIIAIIATLKALFSLDLGQQAISVTFAFTACLLSPLYALSWVPHNFSSVEEATLPRGIRFILSYLLVPLGTIYMVILYAYTAKILILMELPEGGLSYMICGFGAAGSIIQLASYPLKESGNFAVRFFHKYFCLAFIPLIILLFIAIGVRVSQYGVTEGRYAIVLAGVWFLITSIFYLSRRDNKTMKYGPALLTILLVFAAIGPWSAYNVSARSQAAQLEALLVKNNILKNGKIVKQGEQPAEAEAKQITSIVEYLANTGKSARLEFLEDKYVPFKDKYQEKERLMRFIGVKAVSRWNNGSKNFSIRNESLNKPINIKGYDYFFNGQISNFLNPDHNNKNFFISKFDDENFILIIDKEEFTFNLSDLVKKINEIDKEDKDKISEALTLEQDGKRYKVKLVISKLYGNESPQFEVNDMTYSLFYKLK